jgi:hypothetical protein
MEGLCWQNLRWPLDIYDSLYPLTKQGEQNSCDEYSPDKLGLSPDPRKKNDERHQTVREKRETRPQYITHIF